MAQTVYLSTYKCLESIYLGPGTVLDTSDRAGKKTDTKNCHCGTCVLMWGDG